MNQNNQSLIKAAIAITIIAGVAGALSAIGGSIDPSTGKIYATCFMIIFFGITGTLSMVAGNKPENKLLGLAGIAASIGAFLLFSIMLIGENGSEILLKIAFILSIAAIALAHISLLFHITIQNKYAGFARIAATVAISLFSLFIIVQVFEPMPSLYMMGPNQTMIKTITALLLVDLAATLLVPLCNRLHVESPIEQLEFTPEEQPGSPDTSLPIE